MPLTSDDAAFAANWRAVLMVDAVVGLVVVVAGIVGMALGHPLAVVAAVVGGLYVALVARRYWRWKRLRAARPSG